MTEDDQHEHINRRELSLVIDKIAAEIKALESRLTVKILIAALAGSALGKAIGPSVTAALAGLGTLGWIVKAAIMAYHRG